ncbi:MAG: chromosomal replication initiator protein DnaA [Erysipelotrichales bacterium]|nr:chromosomal replication initiator protein DnaA [Erysipelotrichales bacterium]
MTTTISELKTLWDRVLAKLRDSINDNIIFDSFIADSSIHKIEGNQMTIVVCSDFARSIIEKNYHADLLNAVSEVTETNFVLDLILKQEVSSQIVPPTESKPKNKFFENSEINPKYTFENFVVGPSNKEAQQAALMIALNPGKFYNPLFIYSNSGLGKTHLLHAIGNYIKSNNPRLNVLYITTDNFVDEYIKFVKGDRESDGLKDFFRTVDVLLVDDIQFLAKKDKTQEMFFYAFQTLINANKQIVLTSDRQPSDLNGLEERLVTRFSSGLISKIDQPDTPTSIAILKKKIEANGLEISRFDDAALEFLAQNFGNNVRELEGALNRLVFYTINIKQSSHIDLALAQESVPTSHKSKEKKLNESKIISVVSDYYNLTPSQLTGKIRTSEISMARHIAIYLCREILDMPFTKIGQTFGGKDHSTVMSAVKKVEKELKTNEQLKIVIKELKNRLKQ